MQLGDEIINDLRLAWMDVTTLRDTPELFEKEKVAEIGEHAAMLIERVLVGLGLDDVVGQDFDPYDLSLHPDYEDWRSRKHLPLDHPPAEKLPDDAPGAREQA